MNSPTCVHLDALTDDGTEIGARAATDGCVDCLAMGDKWLHLRRCLECGHVGCCDSSPNRHATAHFHGADHPLIQSFEPGEEWIFCYADDAVFELAGQPPSPSHP